MRIRLVSVIIALLASQGLVSAEEAISTTPHEWHKEITPADGALDKLQVLVPFYEGLLIVNPVVSLHEAGFAQFQLAYPGPLSAPCVAWRFGDGEWTAVLADSLTSLPVSLEIVSNGKTLALTLRLYAAGEIKTLRKAGTWQTLTRAVRNQWDVPGHRERLAERFDRVNFYVHQWVADDDPPLRFNWTVEQLATEMKRLKPTTLVHLYGLDPGGIDLGARYFWSDGAEAKARVIISANPDIAHLSWLNLRTYKTAIPRMNREVPKSPLVNDMARQDRAGLMTESGAFNAVDMCLACAAWQNSRLEEFDRLVRVGFRVIQLDEFPIPPVWHVSPCMAHGHLHHPGNAVEEWAQIIKFMTALSRRADAAGVMLTCEEPSAAMLPLVSGYIDRQFNDKIDLYAPWRKSKSIYAIPVFSTMFGDVCTPYTDADEADPARTPPKGWISAHKLYPRSETIVK